MGLAKVRNAAMSLSVSRMWQKLDTHPKWVPSRFNLHGVACALMADQVAAELPVDYAEGAFAAGLLHEVGLLLMAIGLKDEYGQLMRVYTESKHPLTECETTLFGFPHTELSAEILRLWHLPLPIQKAVRQAIEPPQDAVSSLAQLVALSNQLVGQMEIRVQPWIRRYDGSAAETLQALGMGARSEAILSSFRVEVDNIKPFFY
jgi:HD-like signal output (HDOD) protein